MQRLLVSLVLAGILHFDVAVGAAQMGYTAFCLEALAAKADAVVRASVVKVDREASKDQWVWLGVTLEIHETLKGRPLKSLTFAEETLDSNQIFDAWCGAKQEQLWFLTRNERYAGDREQALAAPDARCPFSLMGPGWGVIRLGAAVSAEIDFSRLPPPIFTMDLEVLTDPQRILAATRAAIAVSGPENREKTHPIWLPGAIMQRSGRRGDANRLVVPIDRRLEKLARRLVQSPGDFVRRAEPRPDENHRQREFRESAVQGETNLLRAEGLKALRYFKSADNIALVKPLLDDPVYWINASDDEHGATVKHREYYLRIEADAVLRAWGVDPGERLLRERLTEQDAGTEEARTHQKPEFTMAIVTSYYDANGEPKRIQLEIGDRGDVRRLASFFPEMDQGKEGGDPAADDGFAKIEFVRGDGSRHELSVNFDLDFWSEGNGDWKLPKAFKPYFLKRLRNASRGQ